MSQTPMPFAVSRTDDASTLPFAAPRGRSPWRTITLIALIALALGAAGYAALLWKDQQTLTGALRVAKGELVAAQEARDAAALAASEREAALDKQLSEAQATLGSTREKLGSLQQEVADADAQMQELKGMAARFQRMIDSGKLKVSLRRGRMVVDLPAQVLFPSGSAELSEEGQQSLREVAKILRSVRGKRFIVGGHTDNKKLTRQAEFSSNWALSAARAVTVTEAMVRSGLRPGQLVAAGYGPHDPVATNRTQAGRQDNRRIEIILEPQVRSLPKP